MNNSTPIIIIPFHLGIDPMKRLLVANFRNDPEFEMIEPQLFDDSINGKGLRILRYRTDKKVDVYWQSGVIVHPHSVNVGAGIGDFTEANFSSAYFEISEEGVDLDIAFTDEQNRRNELVIKENNQSSNRFSFLAPVGNDVKKPEKLFLVDMPEFDFVKRANTVFHAKIGSRDLIPSTFPISRDKQKVFFARYASRLIIGEINPPASKPVVAAFTTAGEYKIGEMNLLINEKQEIENIWVVNECGKAELIFEEAFPNLPGLVQNKLVKGRWKYNAGDTALTGGTYSLLRKEEKVYIEFDVTQKWKPGALPFSFKVFTFLVSSFRKWPTTYRWDATVDFAELTIDGHWKRK